MKMTLPETEREFYNALRDAAEVAVKAVLVEIGEVSPYMTQNQAYRKYGETSVNFWINQGLVKKTKDGEGNTRIRLSKIELELAAKTSNRAEWYMEKYTDKRKDKKKQ